MSACTFAFEGTQQEVSYQDNNVYAIAKKHGGLPAGEENGIRGYFLTFMIAYIRDLAAEHKFIAESFETSVPWSNVSTMCQNINKRLIESCKRVGIKENELFVS